MFSWIILYSILDVFITGILKWFHGEVYFVYWFCAIQTLLYCHNMERRIWF